MKILEMWGTNGFTPLVPRRNAPIYTMGTAPLFFRVD